MAPDAAPVSVIVASQGRPEALLRCIAGVVQQDHPELELVVVADAPGRAALARSGVDQWIKCVACETANIAHARNLGLAAAAGEICAFIDDDAVPEPTWAGRLTAPLTGPYPAAAAGGYVRGRNGISFQWQARQVDRTGRATTLPTDPERAMLHSAPPDQAIKTEGTNMAFRRDVLARMGGFDPAFRFYLDETDLNMRLSNAGQLTAIVPLAQVHHGFAASLRRRGDRVPRDLHDIGASTAIFLRKHATPERHAGALAHLRRVEHRRLLRHMVSGALEPRDVGRLMDSLETGIVSGAGRLLAEPEPLAAPEQPFRRLALVGPRPGRLLAGWSWQGRRLRREARAAAGRGAVVTLFRFSPTTFYHRMQFRPDGYWEQVGGLFGRAERDGALLRRARIRTRLRSEAARVAPVRPIDTLVT